MQINIAHTVQNVLNRIDNASPKGANVTLIAVSKTKSIASIISAYQAGVRHFGENRAHELATKATELKHLTDIKWHFIGNLQTRQSHPVAEYAHYFHAIDRLKIARRLSIKLQTLKRILPSFIEVNISGEASKGGFNCVDWENNQQQREIFVGMVREVLVLPNIQLKGLMTMAPRLATQTTIRNIFSRLQQLSKWLNSNITEFQAPELSMGMSADFIIAIAEGASYVRIGSAIFGNNYPE